MEYQPIKRTPEQRKQDEELMIKNGWVEVAPGNWMPSFELEKYLKQFTTTKGVDYGKEKSSQKDCKED